MWYRVTGVVPRKTLGSPMWYRMTGVVPRENIRQSYVVSGVRGGSHNRESLSDEHL